MEWWIDCKTAIYLFMQKRCWLSLWIIIWRPKHKQWGEVLSVKELEGENTAAPYLQYNAIVSNGIVRQQQSRKLISCRSPGLHCIKSCTGSTPGPWLLPLLLSFSLSHPSFLFSLLFLLSPHRPLNSKMNRGKHIPGEQRGSISDRTHLLLSLSPRERERRRETEARGKLKTTVNERYRKRKKYRCDKKIGDLLSLVCFKVKLIVWHFGKLDFLQRFWWEDG